MVSGRVFFIWLVLMFGVHGFASENSQRLAPWHKNQFHLSDILSSFRERPNPNLLLKGFLYNELYNELYKDDPFFRDLLKGLKIQDYSSSHLNVIIYIENVEREVGFEGDFAEGKITVLQVHAPFGVRQSVSEGSMTVRF